MEYLVMLPGPTNVPNKVMNAMLEPIINHRSDDFRILYKAIIEKTQKVFQTNGDIILLTTSGTGVVEASVINLIRKGDKVIIPVNGEFGMRLADLIESWGGQAIRIKSPVDKWNIDVCVTASQKALAAPPGISPISISSRAKKYMQSNPPPTLYLNLKRYFKYYEENFETPFTPALPLFYAFNEALNIIVEEGIENRIKRHKICAEAFYAGLNAMGLTSFAKSDARSNVVISVNYLPGMDDKKFRTLLSEQFKVLIAGGFGELKGKVFRIGSMGEVNKYHVMRTLSSIASSINMLGLNANPEAISVALEKMKPLT